MLTVKSPLSMRTASRVLTSAPRWAWLGAVTALGVIIFLTVGWKEAPVDFNREVRPILNASCISCHGGVKQSSGFGVLFREDALQIGQSGRAGIVPGDPDASEMIRRIVHHDSRMRMPQDQPALSRAEIRTLRGWIKQGAQWADHWAYLTPVPQPLPQVKDRAWPKNGIDHFILARLEAERLRPSPAADCATLIRRVSLDLIGLPSTPAEADAFCRDSSPETYERVVDRLLASPRFGEHWAAMWLDLARYADTKGYEKDAHRNIWRYRDWVIDAFNRDLPFDRFTIEQLAGDLLPGATDGQIVATAFHRNTMTNDEGGTDDEEFRVAAVIDRVNTTWEVWQGTTMACVQCHSHPYEPFRHEDYFKAFAVFNNTADADRSDESPRLQLYAEPEQHKIRDLLARLRAAGASADTLSPASLYNRMEVLLYPRGQRVASSYQAAMGIWGEQEFISPRHDGAYVRYAGVELSGVGEITYGFRPSEAGGAIEVRLGSPQGARIAEAQLRSTGQSGGEERVRVPVLKTEGRHDVYFVLRRPEKGGFRLHWFSLHPALEGVEPARARQISELKRELTAVPAEGDVPVMRELPAEQRRTTQIFEGGNWLVKGDTVAPGVPGTMPPLPQGSPANRLGLSQWLVSPENPLTARVTVNRFWAQLFGTGIVETLEDFGTQGSAPSHPELLDWLALRFMHEHGWSMKALLKEIVLSATYQQSSRVAPELLERDPYNRLLARAPRARLSAEQVRDQALAVSGLLSDKMFGPSVMPPQPPGLWMSPYNSADWKTSEGEDRYRRAVYTYWKRTVPYPSLMTFDAPSREVCVSQRITTNTPLQALVTLNDPVYVEAAQALARRMSHNGARAEDRLRAGYRLAMLREPDAATLASLRSLHEQAARFYRSRPDLVNEALEPYRPYNSPGAYASDPGDEPVAQRWASIFAPPPADSVELAALITVAGAILNLDAFLTNN
jgi:hypothetical protein